MMRKYDRDCFNRHLCPTCHQPISEGNIISAAREVAALIRAAGFGPRARRA